MKKQTQPAIPDLEAPSLTQRDVARRYSCSEMTVRRRMRAGEIPYHIIGRRHVRFKLSDLLKIEAASRVEFPNVTN